MTLAEFLLARIAEDEERFAVDPEEVAAALRPAPNPLWQGDDAYVILLHVRLLAECEAKRRIVERLTRAADVAWSGSYAVRNDALDSLRDLALPYADHSDYDPEWRP